MHRLEAILNCFDIHVQKILWSKYIIAYSLLFAATLLMLSSPLVFLKSNQLERAYANEFEECDLQRTVQIETENNNRFEIEQDFEVVIEEEPEDVCEDSNAKDAKKLKLERGETITVDLPKIEDTGIICLVDKDRSDRSIALGEGSCGINIERFECDGEPQDACNTGELEVEIPEDIDKGKYKIVIGETRSNDDILDLFISKVKIK